MRNPPVSPRDSSTPLRSAQNDYYERNDRRSACPTITPRRRLIPSMICPFAVNRRLLFSYANLDHRALDADDR
jgi:hypothetical protein